LNGAPVGSEVGVGVGLGVGKAAKMMPVEITTLATRAIKKIEIVEK